MNNTNLSISSQTVEYLKTISVEETFTAKQIANAMRLTDDGPVTGLMSRLKNMEIIKEVGRNGRASIYQIAGDLNSYRSKRSPSLGGAEGRHTTGVSRKTRLINSLLSLTAEIEKMKGDLSDFTTHEILKEIEKRTQNHE